MPYPGVPPSKTKDMESCVMQVMDDPKMKSKYPDHDERKSHAIAICHKSIVGSKKAELPSQVTFNINLNDYWKEKMEGSFEDLTEQIETEVNKEDEIEIIEDMEKAVWTTAYVNDLPDSAFAYVEAGEKDEEGKTVPRSKRHLPYKDKDGKPDAAHVRNALARLNQTDISASAKASAKTKLVAAAKQLSIEVSDEKNKMEGGENEMTKTEEETLKAMDADMKACVMGHVKEGKSMKDAQAMCEKSMNQKIAKQDEEVSTEETPAEETAEEKPAEEAETPAEEAASEEKGEEVAEASPVSDLLKQVLGKVEEIQASLKKEDESASAEGAASEEAAPEGGEGDSPVEETAPEGASPEGAEEVAKVSASLNKIADSIEKMTQKFDALEKRVNSLEEQPAPSKVVSPKVVKKEDANDSESPNKERLEEIKTELGKLEEFKRVNLDGYQKEKAWEKAFKLIEERDILLAQAS